ncbi:ACT domain-containing protein [Sporohalobacter salinus]|uniref:ACT domain-containing protein n=1 Tax=Sporohalobacter salinus TaxID=1494606 RepID=UPI00195FD70C|nr:ACT domain-containing protein [Sporohalobacter salinus]MBM7623855.1 chorismate mutase [Sporohalobacter salinus]
MQESSDEYYVVHKDILPTAIVKTVKAKRLLKSGGADKISEAVEKIGLSRSAYYKYKDYAFPFLEDNQQKVITLSLLLKHESGVLSRVINKIAEVKGNVLTINQGIPLQGVANATITIETIEMTSDVDVLMKQLNNSSGIQKVEIIGRNFKY